MNVLKVNLDLVQKYDVAGPRYTSYPPVTKFTDTIAWSELAGKISENNQPERDLSLYFHIPFCETLCWFCGCTTVITLNHKQAASTSIILNAKSRRWPGCSIRDARLSNFTGAAARRRFVARPNPPARRHHPQTLHIFRRH